MKKELRERTYQECAEDFGGVEYGDDFLALSHEPYFDSEIWGFDNKGGYFAIAFNEMGREYRIFWSTVGWEEELENDQLPHDFWVNNYIVKQLD